ncbi:hypothetical protein ZWY2020_045818 [Hordeum vulgare]|nr:hypothetical protein ZWY2020_045818 [Hordeum vulgare]
MMGQTMMRIMRPCFKPSLPDGTQVVSARGGTREGLLWYRAAGRHACGDFSMVVVQANQLLEDASPLEAGPLIAIDGPYNTFVGIYNGHGGPETARFIADNLFHHLKSK